MEEEQDITDEAANICYNEVLKETVIYKRDPRREHSRKYPSDTLHKLLTKAKQANIKKNEFKLLFG